MRIRWISLKEAKDDEDDERKWDQLTSSGTSDVSGLTSLQSSPNFGSEYHFRRLLPLLAHRPYLQFQKTMRRSGMVIYRQRHPY